jgi:hypothetical protein
MARLPHGQVVTPGMVQIARRTQAERSEEVARSAPRALAAAASVDYLNDFDFLFPDLQKDPANLLVESPQTVSDLKQLSFSMVDLNQRGGANDSPIPAAYTYFGQFVDHDVTLEVQPADLPRRPPVR